MTEDVWKEKAEKWLWDSCGYAPDISVKELADWMEKAQKWDGLPRSVRRLFDESTPEQFIQHYKAVDKTLDKLEAVKKVLKEYEDAYICGGLDGGSWKGLFAETLKILEAEE